MALLQVLVQYLAPFITYQVYHCLSFFVAFVNDTFKDRRCKMTRNRPKTVVLRHKWNQ